MPIEKDGYYHIRGLLGYNCKYNLIYSDRGRGKTWDIKHMIACGKGRFMQVFLDQGDMDHALEKWTDELIESKTYTPEEMTLEGPENAKNLVIGGEIKGYFRTLTAVRHIKHEHFNQSDPEKVVNWVWVDEFITPTTTKLKGVKSAGDALRMIVDTLDHDKSHPRETRGLKPLRVIMCANPFTWDDPHGFNAYFHVIPNGFGIHRAGPGIVYEILEPLPKVNGKMSADDFLGTDVTKNLQYADQNSFVEKLPKSSVPFMSLRFDSEFFIVYKSGRTSKGEYHITQSNKHKRIRGIFDDKWATYGTLEGLQEDEVCLAKTKWPQYLLKCTYAGEIRFTDINVKFRFINALRNYKD